MGIFWREGKARAKWANTIEEIAALEAGIKALDKAVAEATEQRKDENAEYKSLMSSNGAAKELLAFAKNRLRVQSTAPLPVSTHGAILGSLLLIRNGLLVSKLEVVG